MQSNSSLPISERECVVVSLSSVPKIDSDAGIFPLSLSWLNGQRWVICQSFDWLICSKRREGRDDIQSVESDSSFSKISIETARGIKRSVFSHSWIIMVVITGDVNGSFIINNEDLCLDDLSSSINANTTENARRGQCLMIVVVSDSDIKRDIRLDQYLTMILWLLFYQALGENV